MSNYSNTRESSPLLLAPSNASGDESSRYYFVGKGTESYQGGSTPAVRDGDGGVVVEEVPMGATHNEFAPRIIGVASPGMNGRTSSFIQPKQSFWGNLFGFGRNNKNGGGNGNHHAYGEVGTLLRPRKAPIKIEPKVFFANERTFLAWMHLSVILAGASIAILAFADTLNNPMSQLYGVVLLPVAICFVVYSMYQYARRSAMIRNRHPGPYEDTVGPVVLGIMLMASIVVQFGLKLYSMS